MRSFKKTCESLDQLSLNGALIVDRLFETCPPTSRSFLDSVASLHHVATQAKEIWFVKADRPDINRLPFGKLDFNKYNFIGNCVSRFQDEPHWYWWHRDVGGNAPVTTERYKSYCDVMALSHLGWQSLAEHERTRAWEAPVEWMIPTLTKPCSTFQ